MTNYDDIIHLPHHVSPRHPQMSMYQRAAQFAPFAALSGHSQAMRDTEQQVADSFAPDLSEDYPEDFSDDIS